MTAVEVTEEAAKKALNPWKPNVFELVTRWLRDEAKVRSH